MNEGGLTPTIGLLKSVKKYLNQNKEPRNFGVHCMLRSRVGDFCYEENEIQTMIEDLKQFVEIGVDGLVFGALTPEVLLIISLLIKLHLISARNRFQYSQISNL